MISNHQLRGSKLSSAVEWFRKKQFSYVIKWYICRNSKLKLPFFDITGLPFRLNVLLRLDRLRPKPWSGILMKTTEIITGAVELKWRCAMSDCSKFEHCHIYILDQVFPLYIKLQKCVEASSYLSFVLCEFGRANYYSFKPSMIMFLIWENVPFSSLIY